MKNRILVMILSLGFVACAKGGGDAGAAASDAKAKAAAANGCNGSKGSVAKIAANRVPTLAPGDYVLEKATLVEVVNGENVVIDVAFGVTPPQDNWAEVKCPADGKIKKPIPKGQSESFEHNMPQTILVNGAGRLEIPETFKMARVATVWVDQEYHIMSTTRASSLQQEGVTKDLIYQVPGATIVPVENGVVLSVINQPGPDSMGGEEHFFFKRK